MEEFNYFRHYDKFLNYKLGIYCDTEKKAKEFLAYLHERNFKWGSGVSLREQTHFNKNFGTTYWCRDGRIYQSATNQTDERYKTIVKFIKM